MPGGSQAPRPTPISTASATRATTTTTTTGASTRWTGDPLSPTVPIGLVESACGSDPWLGYAGVDHDGDGLLSCEDTDDDGDGLPDVLDDCNDASGEPCVLYGLDECSQPTPACHGPGCDDHFDLVMVSVIDPSQALSFRRWQLAEDGIGVHRTAAGGGPCPRRCARCRGRAFDAWGPVAIELRRGGRVVDTVAAFDAVDVELFEIRLRDRGEAVGHGGEALRGRRLGARARLRRRPRRPRSGRLARSGRPVPARGGIHCSATATGTASATPAMPISTATARSPPPT